MRSSMCSARCLPPSTAAPAGGRRVVQQAQSKSAGGWPGVPPANPRAQAPAARQHGPSRHQMASGSARNQGRKQARVLVQAARR